jgi:hypothetical protein
LKALHVEGEVPESGEEPLNPHGGPGGEGGFEFSSVTISGVDVRKSGLAAVTPDQVTKGRYFSESPKRARREAVVDFGYARQNDITVGERTEIGGVNDVDLYAPGLPLRARLLAALPAINMITGVAAVGIVGVGHDLGLSDLGLAVVVSAAITGTAHLHSRSCSRARSPRRSTLCTRRRSASPAATSPPASPS